jgi:hypothetical protein
MIDTRIIKITLAVASFGYMVYLFATGYWGQGIGMFFVTAIIVLLALRSIRLVLAFFQLRQQKMDKAKAWLGIITFCSDPLKVKKIWPLQSVTCEKP